VLDGGSIAGWARKQGVRDEEVHMTLSGTRPYPAIREKMAETAKMSREEIDRIIGGRGEEKVPA
jgi:cytidylate kinase